MSHPSFQHVQPLAASLVTPASLDATALDRLRALDPTGTTGVVRRVFEAYAASLARLMEQLSAARACGDLAGVRHVTHTLKSSSASIGALAFSNLCGEIENMVRQQQCDRLDACLDALSGEAERVAEAVQAMLAV